MNLSSRWIAVHVTASLMILLTSASAQTVFLYKTIEDDVVMEGDSVEICVIVVNKQLIAGTAFVTLVTSLTDFGSIGEDYIPLQQEFVFTSSSPSNSCVTLLTLRDNSVEDTEIVNILLVNNSGVNVGPPLRLSIIPANDSIIVEFVVDSYTVSESAGSLDLSVRLAAGSVERAFPSYVVVEFTITDISAEDTEEYSILNSVQFSVGDPVGTVKEVQLRVTNDNQVEGNTTLKVVIVSQSSSLHPVSTTESGGMVEVTVIDDDVASVALLGPAVVSVIEDGSEGMMRSSVDICLELVVEVAVERDVVVFLDVENITADDSDYSLGETLLTFHSGSLPMATTCTKLYIIPDDLEEEDEKVTIHVSPIAPDVLSEHSQMNVAVTLLNDDVNCDQLPTQSYPVIIDTNGDLTEGAMATYSCASGYNITGGGEWICMNGSWTGQKTICTVIDCGEPPIPEDVHGIDFINTTFNSTARYVCYAYKKREHTYDYHIRCLANGSWSQPKEEFKCSPLRPPPPPTEKLVVIIVVAHILVLGFIVGLVLVVVCRHCTQRSSRRSGKYVVDNSGLDIDDDPVAMNNAIILSPIKDNKESENQYMDIASSPTYI